MTPLFQPAPSVMLVGLDLEPAEACTRALPGLLVLRVGHPAAAIERMLVTRPLVVVLGAGLARVEEGLVVECARDIRAEVVHESGVLPADLPAFVRDSILEAERNRDRPTAPP